jgi:hypothetical protein
MGELAEMEKGMVSEIPHGCKITLGFKYRVPAEGHLFTREEFVKLQREDLAKGGYELGSIDWEKDRVGNDIITTLKHGDKGYVITFPYIPPEGLMVKPKRKGGRHG